LRAESHNCIGSLTIDFIWKSIEENIEIW
jgi:hypothetical protein